MFLIPYIKLSDEQKEIVRQVSRTTSNLFVEGPPGSGKTLISLYTLKNMIEDQVAKPLVLIYNHSLYGYLKSSIEELNISDNLTLETKDQFFWNLAREKGIRAYGNESYEIRYNSLLDGLLNTSLKQTWDIAVIDEVQDMSRKEWAIINKISKRITSMGDFNQGVYNTDLTREEVIGRDTESKRLRDIFRFHKAIAIIAERFSKKKDKLEQKVTKIESKDVTLVDVEQEGQVFEINKIIKSLIPHNKSIGIISPSKDVLKQLHQKLKSLGTDNIYFSNNKEFRNHDFSSTIPLLIPSPSSKGLEFENVIVVGFNENENVIQKLRNDNNLEEIIYVSLTRANSGLYIIRNPDTIPEIQNIEIKKEQKKNKVSLDDIFDL